MTYMDRGMSCLGSQGLLIRAALVASQSAKANTVAVSLLGVSKAKFY